MLLLSLLYSFLYPLSSEFEVQEILLVNNNTSPTNNNNNTNGNLNDINMNNNNNNNNAIVTKKIILTSPDGNGSYEFVFTLSREYRKVFAPVSASSTSSYRNPKEMGRDITEVNEQYNTTIVFEIYFLTFADFYYTYIYIYICMFSDYRCY